MAGERLREALQAFRTQYSAATRPGRSTLLDELCRLSGYHRKYAIALLNRSGQPPGERPRRRRGVTYSAAALRVIEAIWKAAGHPWAERLKALLPLWLPWARRRVDSLTDEVGRQVLQISARQIDRRLRDKKRRLKRRLYGRTKPGTLLKHQVPIKAEPWDVGEPGWTEIDLVSHSGPSACGEFGYSLNLTDVYLGWCETRAVLGRGEAGVVAALDQIRRRLPFALRGIDSDNGSEFINYHLVRYCRQQQIQFTRGRPYKKDDNAHIEQKNWTHVRRLLGWDRYETPRLIAAVNELYAGPLRVMMNLFQPSVKLLERRRVGSRLTRRYEAARTPLDRLEEFYAGYPLPEPVRALLAVRERTDPFELAAQIERQLEAIEHIRAGRGLPAPRGAARAAAPLSPQGGRIRGELTHALR
jgi:transposase InsO family protein